MGSQLLADASYDEDQGVAALGVVDSGGKIIAVDAAMVQTVQEGEAWALLRALTFLVSRPAPPGSLVTTDNLDIYKRIEDGGYMRGVDPRLLDRIRYIVAAQGYRVEWVPRKGNGRADAAARLALRLWRAGSEGGGTWSPNPL